MIAHVRAMRTESNGPQVSLGLGWDPVGFHRKRISGILVEPFSLLMSTR